jgi:hypothetical protein
MIPNSNTWCLGSIPRRLLVLALALSTPLLVIGFVSPAWATEPTGDFAIFKQCPRFTTGVAYCLYAQTESGEVTIGTSTVPIEKTITLQGGYTRNELTGEEKFVGALNGDTLSKTPQAVPGGLAGLIKCNEITEPVARLSCELVFQNGLTGVNATTELAKPASEIGISTDNLVNEEGVALSLPLKLHLENPLLGSSCYIGSSASPVTFNLTSGTTSPPPPNKPISGKPGELSFKDNFGILEFQHNTLVDNSFSAPKASGCGGLLSLAIDPVINAKLGLPSPAGKNTAIQNNTVREATAETVIANEH